MGADARIFVFDYGRYRAEIVPALVELVRTGTAAPWFAGLMPRFEDPTAYPHLTKRLRDQPVDLARYCDWLGPDLRYTGTEPVDRSSGKQLACASQTCPARAWCLFHRDHDRHAVEGVNALYEALVAVCCLGPSKFVGRSVTPNFYLPVLERHGIPAGDPVQGLLIALATRGAVLGYQFGATEGIHGWLTVSETAELVAGLGRLDLPPGEPLFPTAAAAVGELLDWREVSLSRLRMVATSAAESGQGVLWGNDVGPEVWTELYGVRDPRL